MNTRHPFRGASLGAACLVLSLLAQGAQPPSAAAHTAAGRPGAASAPLKPATAKPTVRLKPVDQRETTAAKTKGDWVTAGQRGADGKFDKNGIGASANQAATVQGTDVVYFDSFKDAVKFTKDMNKAQRRDERKGNNDDTSRGGNTPNGKNGVDPEKSPAE